MAGIEDRTYLRGGGGITAVEAYHAGAVRMVLAQQANRIVQPFGVSVASICQVRDESGSGREGHCQDRRGGSASSQSQVHPAAVSDR